ncbi:CMRF35-like molecule 3 [Polyodon spathula]|uniref:CMRF35-like molecule 3 n=1 Tax=Polyodon spathula TaxID=7913 RepID=UPI001B7E6D04|nr:CMRF35-like molecule 3 [Polyodon spathula]
MDFLLVFLAMVLGTYSLSPESEFTGLVGGSVSVPCHYDVKYRDHVKYWCTGWIWASCIVLGRTDDPPSDEGTYSLSLQRNITGCVGESVSRVTMIGSTETMLCTGRLWSNCTVLKRTNGSLNDEDKILIDDDKTQGVFTMTVRSLEKKDAGWYWCAIERKGYIKIDKRFQLHLDVVDAPTTPQTTMSSIFSTCSNQHTSQETTTIIQYSTILHTSSRPDR